MKYSTIKTLIDSLYAFEDDCSTVNMYWDQILHVIETVQDFDDTDKAVEFETRQFQKACVAKYMLEELEIELDMDTGYLIEAYGERMKD